MNLINLTPHAINILAGDFEFDAAAKCYRVPTIARVSAYDAETGYWRTDPDPTPVPALIIESTGIARCAVQDTDLPALDVDGTPVPCCGVTFGAIEGLPEPQEDTIYIVSAIVANAGRAQGRTDLAVPARMVRDEAGHVLGCLALAR